VGDQYLHDVQASLMITCSTVDDTIYMSKSEARSRKAGVHFLPIGQDSKSYYTYSHTSFNVTAAKIGAIPSRCDMTMSLGKQTCGSLTDLLLCQEAS
jgi:hypothetical protein